MLKTILSRFDFFTLNLCYKLNRRAEKFVYNSERGGNFEWKF